MLTNDIMFKYMFPLKCILMYKDIVPTYIWYHGQHLLSDKALVICFNIHILFVSFFVSLYTLVFHVSQTLFGGFEGGFLSYILFIIGEAWKIIL